MVLRGSVCDLPFAETNRLWYPGRHHCKFAVGCETSERSSALALAKVAAMWPATTAAGCCWGAEASTPDLPDLHRTIGQPTLTPLPGTLAGAVPL
jgi:hypothetical protein